MNGEKLRIFFSAKNKREHFEFARRHRGMKAKKKIMPGKTMKTSSRNDEIEMKFEQRGSPWPIRTTADKQTNKQPDNQFSHTKHKINEHEQFAKKNKPK